MSRAPLLLALVGLSGCVRSARPPTSAGAEATTVTATLEVGPDSPLGRHAGVDMCFPTVPPAGWTFDGARHYDNTKGLDISWAYSNTAGTNLSVYVYPHHESMPSDRASHAEAEARHHALEVSNVEWSASAELNGAVFGVPGFLLTGIQQKPLAPLLPENLHAEVAQKLGLPSLDGVMRSFGTLIVVWSSEDWFVKLRVTWLDVETPAEDVLEGVLAWSALPCSVFRDAETAMPMVDVPLAGLPAAP